MSVTPPFVLVPPSQGKTIGGVTTPGRDVFGAQLASHRCDVVAALSKVLDQPEGVARVTGARGALLDRARRCFEQIVIGDAPLLPTWQRYNGVVWRHLDAASIATQRRGRLLVPSALYGITAGDDVIADSRLTFPARVDGLGRLDDFWRDAVTDALCAVIGAATLVDLLPREHRRAIDWTRVTARGPVIEVRFQDAGGARAAGHGAKAVKGIVARRLVEDGVDSLGRFAWRD